MNEGGVGGGANEPVVVLVPPSAPAWFADAFGQVSEVEIGPTYLEVLKGFVELEAMYGFEKGSANAKLSAVERPRQVAEWIRGGRGGRKKAPPAIPAVDAFAVQWWSWWTGMQPAWREQANGKPVRVEAGGEEWGELVCPGLNGFLSVVATLYWWGCAEKAGVEGKISAGWEEAAADVIWVLRSLKAAAAPS
ncbi:hypothetical protein B0H11DRAFT_1731058 [Mycena galericulata]|nr:hypothetical protein B0H11DRAFT_1731058 [Mycena galericulata]